MPNQPERVLALDVSGTATGWAYGVDGRLEGWGKYISKASETKGEKLYHFYLWVEEMITAKQPNIILIERPYRGRNSNVLANISKFIAIVELAACKVIDLEIQPEWFLDPKVIKNTLKVKKGANYDDNKRLMVLKINSLYGLKLKFGNKKSKNYNDDDISDAIAILTAWWKIHEE